MKAVFHQLNSHIFFVLSFNLLPVRSEMLSMTMSTWACSTGSSPYNPTFLAMKRQMVLLSAMTAPSTSRMGMTPKGVAARKKKPNKKSSLKG